ncbi:hypothetical protein ACFXTO_024826 [Malus domestica]
MACLPESRVVQTVGGQKAEKMEKGIISKENGGLAITALQHDSMIKVKEKAEKMGTRIITCKWVRKVENRAKEKMKKVGD